MIGHIILKRSSSIATTSPPFVNSSSTSTIGSSSEYQQHQANSKTVTSQSFGLKIIGGRLNPLTNQTSAYVVKVKKNSLADQVGKIQIGDEIVKWNGVLLRDLSYDEVFNIISKSSKLDDQVELIIERLKE